MKARPLVCHQQGRPPASLSIEAWVECVSDDLLRFHYLLRGDLSVVRLPAPHAATRADGLWRHTCFEAFLRPGTGPAYLELNFSPSTCWAVYAFTGYREGMRSVETDTHPRVCTKAEQELLRITADVPAAMLSLTPHCTCRLALSAVIEDTGGHRTYWALAHPPGQPDFHHDAGFVINIEGSDR